MYKESFKVKDSMLIGSPVLCAFGSNPTVAWGQTICVPRLVNAWQVSPQRLGSKLRVVEIHNTETGPSAHLVHADHDA